jgi:hypothetical protein
MSEADFASLLELEDDAVRNERAAVVAERHNTSSGAHLVLDHLRKKFDGGKVAVRDLCLRVYEGECFGFLGVNGAGKSTTFAMLTGAVQPSAGDARLFGKSVLTQQAAIRQEVGFCPQHDALEGLLNAREQVRARPPNAAPDAPRRVYRTPDAPPRRAHRAPDARLRCAYRTADAHRHAAHVERPKRARPCPPTLLASRARRSG